MVHTDSASAWSRRFVAWLAVLLVGASFAARTEGAPPAVPLAEVYRGDVAPAEYWVSEKLDGVRAVWDGRTMHFRSGEPVAAPPWFVAGLPTVPLDGELWIGRGAFDRLSGTVRRHVPDDAEWRAVRYMIFELPGAPGTFTERVATMREIVAAAGVPWLEMVAQERVANRVALERRLARVLAEGGEGLMLHRADAPWVTGRTSALLKVKPWFDAEARVVGHVAGRGRYRGALGALEVEDERGRRFRIGTGFSDEVRRAPPPVGALITYRYRTLTPGGIPRSASFLRVRDLP